MNSSLDWNEVSSTAYTAYAAGDFVAAKRLLLEALPGLNGSADDAQQARADMTVGHCLASTGDFAAAELHFRKAIQLYRHFDPASTAYCYSWLAICLFKLEHWLDAALTFDTAHEWLERGGDASDLKRQIADMITYGGRCYWNAGKLAKAEERFASALKRCAMSATPPSSSAWLVRCLFEIVNESGEPCREIARLARRASGLVGRKLAEIPAPQSPRSKHKDSYFGTTIADPYRWLEDTHSAAVKEWVCDQNRRAELFLSNIPGRTVLHQRAHELFQQKDPYVPSRTGKWYFFQDKPVGSSRPRFCCVRKLGQFPRVIIDAEKFPAGDLLSWVKPSPNARYVVYAVSPGGSQWETLRIRDVVTGKDLKEELPGLRHMSLQWAPDSSGFYYCAVRRDDQNARQTIRFHRLRRTPSRDVVLHEEPDSDLVIGLTAIVLKKYLLINTTRGSKLTYSVLLKPLSGRDSKPRVLFAEQRNEFHLYNNWNGRLYFITDYNAPRKRLISVLIPKGAWRKPAIRDELRQWKHVLRHAWPCKQFNTGVYVTEEGTVLRRVDRAGKVIGETKLPAHTSLIKYTGGGYPRMFLKIEGYTQPPAVLEYNAESGSLKPFGRGGPVTVGSGFVTETVQAESKDGTRVPIHISYRKGLRLNGDNPLILTAYGGFNRWAQPAYDQYDVAWMEMGGVIAEAAIRGGGEFGSRWRLAATGEHKQNCFDDYIAAAEWLIDSGYTRPARLGVVGGSNGGLLAGAVVTQRPELFGAVHMTCSLLDMLRYHHFDLARYYVAEYGCSTNRKQFQALLGYSPLHKLRKREYPPTLICTSTDDDLVNPAHSYKFTAAMQTFQTGTAPILLRVEEQAGHAGHHQSARGVDRLAFFAHTLGLMPDALLREAAQRWRIKGKESGRAAAAL